jgi:hypothetical protein
MHYLHNQVFIDLIFLLIVNFVTTVHLQRVPVIRRFPIFFIFRRNVVFSQNVVRCSGSKNDVISGRPVSDFQHLSQTSQIVRFFHDLVGVKICKTNKA